MRSETLLPLLQFVEWWGIDAWYAAGIDIYNKTGTTLATQRNADNNCICMLQHPWDSKGNWSRDDLIEMLTWAEEMFVRNVGFYPAPYYIEDERKSLKDSVFTQGNVALVKPEYSCYFSEFGAYSLELLDTVTLTRDDGAGTVYTEFTTTVAVPANTEAKDIKVFFTQSDGSYTTDPEFNDKEFEIRPLNISVSGLVATISGYAFLFKKPEHDDVTECLKHELDTYVSEVAVYLVNVDYCSQGNFVSNGDCSDVPCTTELQNACFREKTVKKQIYGYAFPASCSDNTITKACLTTTPSEIQYNYLTGADLQKDNYAEKALSRVIFGLAVGLASCVKDWCNCDICPEQKVNYFRDTPKYINDIERNNNQYNREWQIVLSKSSIDFLDGLQPNNGILQFARFDKNNKCNSVEGSIL